MSEEPSLLKKGKQFHEHVQDEWLRTAGGRVRKEKNIPKSGKRGGRADIFVDEIGDDLVSIVEIKNTDWDKIKLENIRRNVKRQARQLWRYIDDTQEEFHEKSVSPGIIFPKLPNDTERIKLVESLFEREFIQVAWQDESLDRVRKRLRNGSNGLA